MFIYVIYKYMLYKYYVTYKILSSVLYINIMFIYTFILPKHKHHKQNRQMRLYQTNKQKKRSTK